ncbi:Gfo/Idh/MocA family oxidoreductase [Nissabacter sp. SGAir0207]|uniref:Gfo/Idh/MocA family protein n=1 Tax=Nissabacter sp. SGAir0207 TaxID=2126321 RepID=UPI001F0DD139|nr:Gfo/Idh/MocA family oxidoreductase [Nissabacter sp. SGAir0207]
MTHQLVTSERIRTALVGFGISGQVFHAPLLAADPHFSLAAIVTSREDRILAAQQRYPQAQILADWQDLLRRIDSGELTIDLIVLGTPPALHAQQAQEASARGIHLVVDKPFAANARQAAQMIAGAEASRTLLTVFHNRRWDGDFLTLQRLLAEEALGRVRSFESRFEWWRPEGFGNWRDRVTLAEGGGLLLDLGSHLIDQAIQLFGPVRTATAELARHSPATLSDSDEDAFVSLLHESGVRSRLWMNGQAARPAPRFHLLGSRAAYTSWGLDNQEPDLAGGITPDDAAYGITPEARWGTLGQGTDEQRVTPVRGDYPAFYRQLALALREGAPPPVDAYGALAVLRVIDDLHARFAVRSA